MFAAVGTVHHVQENEEREVVDAELVRVVLVEAESSEALYQKMSEQELIIRHSADAEVMRAELEEQDTVVYPMLNWERIYSVDSSVNVITAVARSHRTDDWKSYDKFGAIRARETVIETLRDEAQHRLDLLASLAAEKTDQKARELVGTVS